MRAYLSVWLAFCILSAIDRFWTTVRFFFSVVGKKWTITLNNEMFFFPVLIAASPSSRTISTGCRFDNHGEYQPINATSKASYLLCIRNHQFCSRVWIVICELKNKQGYWAVPNSSVIVWSYDWTTHHVRFSLYEYNFIMQWSFVFSCLNSMTASFFVI